MSEARISYGRRLTMLATAHPDTTAMIFVPEQGEERTVTWAELEKQSNQIARLLAHHGVDEHAMVVVGLPNSPAHFFATFAAWKLGALTLPLRSVMAAKERDAILALGKPQVVVANWPALPYTTLSADALDHAADLPDDPLPDIIPHPGKSIGSGGSTGRPKIIVDPAPWASIPGQTLLTLLGAPMQQRQLVAGPLYHNAPFLFSHLGLFEEHTLIVMERFHAARVVDMIERHQIQVMYLAPIMMDRIIKLPGVKARDFSSINFLGHTAAPCPPWLKRAWIDLVGAESVLEVFGATELVGVTAIRGDEWLTHPGSVGRPLPICEMRICDADGQALPPGEVGEIFMRRVDTDASYHYIGAPPLKSDPEGFASVGDLGWVDEAGYLFIADRRVDLIITGGANVYPAEVEAALTEHPAIGDVAVIGVPDAEWGKRVHAVIEPLDPAQPPSVTELDTHCREHLTSYKVPKSYEFIASLPREPSGKIRRAAMVEERESGWTPAMMKAKT
jgi:bile acid-coenzyme A ligase